MKVSPRIIPGSLCAANKYACDWGWQGLLAYGCNSFVVVFDSRIVQIIQTLHHHQHPAAIVRVRWARDKFNHDVNSPYKLKLAAANQAGHVMIWDVVTSELLNEFSEPGKPVLEMHWMHRTEVFIGCLLVLFSPGLLVLLNTETGTRLWRKSFHDPLISFALDPFDLHSAAVMSQDWIMFLHGLHPSSPPSEQSKKFYITSNSSRGTGPGAAVPTPMKAGGTSKSTFAKMKSWAGDIRGKNDDENLSSDCLQIAYSPTNKGHFLMLFPREILILDLEFGQAVGSFTVDVNSPSFLQIIPCKYRDAFFCLHDNGSITFKLRRPPESIPYNQSDSLVSSKFPPDIFYDAKCHSDVFRLSRLCRIMCFSVCPRSEKEVSLVLSDGRLLFWEIASEPQVKTLDYTTEEDSSLCLAEMIPSSAQFHASSRQKNQLKIKFQLSKMYSGIAPNPTCLKMCPSLTTKNWAVYTPMAAVGTSGGIVQFVRVDNGAVRCEFAVHTTAVKGLEWMNLSVLLSFAHSSSGSAKSEIQMIDRLTGRVCALPTSRGLQESYVTAIKLSYQRQYFVTIYKNQHAELWDAKTMIQLREFPANSPLITALEWTPAYYSSKGKKKNAAHAKGDLGIGADNAGAVLENTRKTEQKKVYTKEDLAFTNPEGHIFHYIIEGTSIKEGSRVPPEVGMGTITQMAWKDELLMCGDVLGNVNVWDLKHRKSRNFETGRSGVKRMKFAPGKSHMRLLILCGDGVVCWEQADSPSVPLGIKTKKDHPDILDADWLSSDIPLLLYSDGSLRAMDESFKDTNFPIEKKYERDYSFSPRILLPSAQMLLRTLMESQPWNSEYDLDFRDMLDSDTLKNLGGVRKAFPVGILKRLLQPAHGTAERCWIVSRLFGDEFGFEFWTVALYYLRKEKGTRSCDKHKGIDYTNKRRSSYKDVVYADGTKGIQRTESDTGVSSLGMSADGEHDIQKPPAKCTCFNDHLDSCFDVLCDNEFYQELQLYNIAIKDGKRLTPEQSRICARKMILAGETDRAVQILLETDPNDSSYYSDALRACLIATVRSSGASQSTIKLVATNFIANGKLSEGIELLCLVDKGVDACRYLQTYGQWDLATWLAKVSLSRPDFVNILQRWADHLSSSHMNQKNKALMVMLSIGNFPKALEILYSLGHISRAVLLLESCVEFQLLSLTDERHRNLFENIFVEYARQMHKLGLSKAVSYYCRNAGGRGQKLLEDLGDSGCSPVKKSAASDDLSVKEKDTAPSIEA